MWEASSVTDTYCPGRCQWWQHWLRKALGGQHPGESWGTPRKTQILRWMGSGCRPWWSNCSSEKRKPQRCVSVWEKSSLRPPVIYNVNNAENNLILRIIRNLKPALDIFQFLCENVLTNSRRVLLSVRSLRAYLLSFSRFELHLFGAGDVVDPGAGWGGVWRSSSTPHRGHRGQVTAMAQHWNFNCAWSVEITRGGLVKWWKNHLKTTSQKIFKQPS